MRVEFSIAVLRFDVNRACDVVSANGREENALEQGNEQDERVDGDGLTFHQVVMYNVRFYRNGDHELGNDVSDRDYEWKVDHELEVDGHVLKDGDRDLQQKSNGHEDGDRDLEQKGVDHELEDADHEWEDGDHELEDGYRELKNDVSDRDYEWEVGDHKLKKDGVRDLQQKGNGH